jgi:hypothetical protein
LYLLLSISKKSIQKISQTNDDINLYINSQNLEKLKNCDEFDFSKNEYHYFFQSLLTK